MFGLSENLEELEAFLSWENGRSNKLIKKQLKVIDKYFTEQDNDVEYLSADEIEVAIRDKFGKKDIDELVVQEEELMKKKMSLIKNRKLKDTILKLHEDIDKARRSPRFPYKEGAREYQVTAYQNWLQNGSKGILQWQQAQAKQLLL